ncbi:MAG: replicative DNA helicase, partial [Planctomycetota bacterium]|nr:replicative DNA helicase [Planctomycetota bacterium]
YETLHYVQGESVDFVNNLKLTTMATETISQRSIISDFQYPFDLSAESALLGSLLLDNTQMGEVLEIIKANHFYHLPHRLIFETMVQSFDNRKVFDTVILKNELLKKGNLEKVGGIENIVSILESVPTASNAIYYAEIIKEKYILRTLANISDDIRLKINRGQTESETLLEEAQKSIFEISQEKDKTEVVSIKDIVTDVFRQIQSKSTAITGLSTGLSKIDELTSGLQPSQFVVIAGRPGSGKSSFALRLMEEVAIKGKKPVVLYTLEVTAEQIVKNLLCTIARIDSNKFRKSMLTEEERRHLLDVLELLKETPIFIDDTSGLSVFELRNRSRRLKSQNDIQLIIVDYLQLMRWEDAEYREREIAYISSSLKGLAKELNIPVVAMAQLSREPERRPLSTKHPRPRLSDLRESGAIEQDADVVLLLYRDEMYNPEDEKVKNVCEINIAKQRNGPSGNTVKVTFLKEFYRFEDRAIEEMEEMGEEI